MSTAKACKDATKTGYQGKSGIGARQWWEMGSCCFIFSGAFDVAIPKYQAIQRLI